jgi:hypothetical protein
MPQTSERFDFDVFLSHSFRDKDTVRELADRLRTDGLKVWFDEWVLKPGDSIPAKIEEGLEHSRVIVLCMSANAFGSDWAQLEAGTFRFRDPLNKERRFIPLRLDDTPIKGSLAQFFYISWLPHDREKDYAKLLEACQQPAKSPSVVMGMKAKVAHEKIAEKAIQLDYKAEINAYAFSPDGKYAFTGATDNTLRLWDLETGLCLRRLTSQKRPIQHRIERRPTSHSRYLRWRECATSGCGYRPSYLKLWKEPSFQTTNGMFSVHGGWCVCPHDRKPVTPL